MNAGSIAIVALVLKGSKPKSFALLQYFLAQWMDTVDAFAEVFESEYSLIFDRELFLKACDYPIVKENLPK